jgi:polysaccharide export outer membrane protein
LISCASSRSRPPDPATPAQRALRAGDILRVEVWRQPEYSGEFQVGANGTLLHPLYQEIRVAGLSADAARGEIAEFLSEYLQGARLMVEPLYGVSIGGEVRSPDVYHVGGGTTVAESIGLAGGPTARAELNRVLLVRDGEQYDMSLGNEVSTFGSIPIVSGDQILVYPQSDFSLWRDVIAPVATLASLVLVIIRIGERT